MTVQVTTLRREERKCVAWVASCYWAEGIEGNVSNKVALMT